ncbi:hypothetical protein CDL15_Pgr026859 [Punica granatum]|uniref:Bifunctional inhibitor/plant lipid transfer protein/seed storage helical domain-containing protein n=1 Tax=Punica granatum TaxID=22663 RepID=A0A218WLT2_PUNGR|nr:hypothetical protein CDL15_Pgr026859 [Punica granatum]
MTMGRALNLLRLMAALAIVSTCTIENVSTMDMPTLVPVLAPAPGQGTLCEDMVMSNMLDCIPFISVGNSSDRPVGTCCSGLKAVMDFNGACICVAISISSQFGIELNMTRVKELPLICKLKPYPLEKCAIEPPISPAPTPPKSGTPAPLPPESKAPAPGPLVGGKTPAEPPKKSGCHSLISSIYATLFSISLVICCYHMIA